MIVFLDIEFTDLLDPQLLSLGLADLEGHEFYAELDLESAIGKARLKTSSEFVRYNGVIDQWGLVSGASGTEWEMGRRAGEWILGLATGTGRSIEIAFDYSMDYELLEYAIRDAGLWEQVREVVIPRNIDAISGTITGELAAEECYRSLKTRGLARHHALADALALRAAYLAKSAALLLGSQSS
ncbi:hypothetical protein [Polaromonas sp.]|uniref:hypothetical protein n=1 Tax=Polaromonas sp. TaxID=1869339 RepID=UPI002731DB02|nr:hypothetical protein [Polaromonas sp.]MDP1740977.1 hypothetical protein [Polaromonas sp.]